MGDLVLLLITVLADLFRRHDIGGGAKVLWMIFVIVLPFLGVFLYLLTQNQGMTERSVNQAEGGPGVGTGVVSIPGLRHPAS